MFRALAIASVLGLAAAQVPGYAQCGGNGYSGSNVCASGFSCNVINEWYHQCLPGGSSNPNPNPGNGGSTSSSVSSSAVQQPTSTRSAPANEPTFPGGGAGASGSGKTTRYWDCCKPSCSWPGKAPVSNPVNTCNAQNQVIGDSGAKSGCDGGGAYMCSNQQPWAVSDTLAYGFAAVNIAGQNEYGWCCSCYELTFTSGPASGKRMIVQATNTGADLGHNHFDIAMPGGGVGIFNACSTQYNAPTDGWGQRYGGVSTRDQCSVIPDVIRNGCQWRWDWWNGSDNPDVRFREVQCPTELTSKTGCVRR